MTAASAAALAGMASLAAYLDGKYHIGQDLRVKRRKKQAIKYYADLGESCSLIFLHFRELIASSEEQPTLNMVLIRSPCHQIPGRPLYLV